MNIIRTFRAILRSIQQKLGLTSRLVTVFKKGKDVDLFNVKGHLIRYSDIDEYKFHQYVFMYRRKMKVGKFDTVDSKEYYRIQNPTPRNLKIDKLSIDFISLNSPLQDGNEKEDMYRYHFVVNKDGVVEFFNDINTKIRKESEINIIVPVIGDEPVSYKQKTGLVTLVALLVLYLKLHPKKAINVNGDVSNIIQKEILVNDVVKKTQVYLKNLDIIKTRSNGIISSDYLDAIRQTKHEIFELLLGVNADEWKKYDFWKKG